MKQSFSYHLTLFVIKLKGLKKTFQQNPINVQHIRREDVLQPKGRFFNQHARRFTVANSTITSIQYSKKPTSIILFIHGGAFISGPAQHHWDSIKTIAKNTKACIWLCDYPKAPEHKIDVINQNVDEVYKKAKEEFPEMPIVLIGDSVGGNLVSSLTQRLIKQKRSLPHSLILISPVMDASLTNPEIEKLEQNDPVLAKAGALSAKQMAAGEIQLKDARISPLYGSFEHFPPTTIYAATRDIMYPDTYIAFEKMKAESVEIEFVKGVNMPHIWPLLPVMKEAKKALSDIIQRINRIQ